ncbi:phosphatase PAP2 family protein [Nocardioides sp.]|uniref:phosphatase PAP2 family protein n=1 Tax=Nocardioides sp. TaxID=35761 RepID=UPI0025D11520|nr:phosphatase PAP2 family protein [Nocardioides sp.]
MTFLTRWDDASSRPTVSEAGRDLAVRVVAPMTAWWLVVMAIGWAITDGPLKQLGHREERFNKWLASGRTSVLDTITLVFSWTGATVSIIGVCLVVVAVVWWRTRRWWFAVVPLIAISAQALVFFFTTLLIDRERPHVEKLDDSPPTSSFPSGHTGAATGLYFTLALMALRIKHPGLRGLVVTVCLLVPLLVASARLYRGMHHLSDVIVAIVNGLIAGLLAWGWLRAENAGPGSPARAAEAGEQRQSQTRA